MPASRGEVWTVDFDPVVGHEQGGARPAIVVSRDSINHGKMDLVIVAAITSKGRPVAMHVPIEPPEAGLTRPSIVLCEQIRTVSIRRLRTRLGQVAPATMTAVADRIKIVLDL